MADADAAEEQAADLRAELDTRVASQRAAAAGAVRDAELVVDDADAALRALDADATRWRSRADTLASTLDAAHAAAGGSTLGALDGIAGPLLDHVEIEA